jgi:hypothetical protein
MKPKKCKVCKEVFTPIQALQSVCGYKCAISHAKEVKAKQQRAKDKMTREGLKSNSDYLKELQKEINTIVRLIDKGSQCISTLKPLNDKFDAGHLYSVGSNPALRFHLDNIHAQSVYANQYLSGDQINYINGLSEVYGKCYKDYVLNLKSVYKVLKLSQDELKEKITIAGQIVKELKVLDLQYPPKVRLELRKKYNERLGIYT